MNQKQSVIFLGIMVFILASLCVALAVRHQAHGEVAPQFEWKAGYDKCPCFTYIPEENSAAANETAPNWAVEIHLPPNDARVIVGTMNDANFTHLKENPAAMATYFHTTTATPDLNYCPNAKYILQNQGVPQYLDRLYNPAKGVNLTNYVYPTWCQVESGPNPIDGNHSAVVAIPEFNQVVGFILLAAAMIVVMHSRKKKP